MTITVNGEKVELNVSVNIGKYDETYWTIRLKEYEHPNMWGSGYTFERALEDCINCLREYHIRQKYNPSK